MDIDFEESLPSNSNLIAPIRHGSALQSSQERRSYDYSHYMEEDNDNNGRAASPPPPPPPAHSLVDEPAVRRMSEPALKQQTNAAPRTNAQGKPSFPFLKKGSRQEPSALHRSPNSKSPRSPAGVSPNATSSRVDSGGNSPSHDIYGSGLKHRPDPNPNEDFDPNEESDEIFLTGTGYWQADDMKSHRTSQHGISGAHLGGTRRSSQHQSGHDHLDSSTVNIGGEQWQQQRDAGQEELDEFELIERQLENSALTNTFGAVNKSLASSRNFSANHTAYQPAARPAAVKSNTDVWSDAYEHDAFAKTKNMQREGTQPNRASFVNTNTFNSTSKSHFATSNFGESNPEDGQGDDDEQYAEDFSGEEDQNEADGSPNGGGAARRSVAAYLEQVSPQQRTLEQERAERKQQEHSRSQDAAVAIAVASRDNAARASRPSYSNYWDDAAEAEDEYLKQDNHVSGGALERPAPAIRNTESPSWGRSTQPVGNSLESDGASEQDDSRSGPLSSRTLEANKVAHMSNSALRKISSRTAALHSQAPPSKVERPTLADDTNSARDGFSDAEESTAKNVQYTRPTPVRRGLASTHAGPTPTAKPRSSSTGGRLRPGAVAAADAAQTNLTGKAQELEKELETYRSENANLRKLRKQQETALAEVVHQKEEVMRWAADERAKTQRWCEEQTAAATKERNAAAKLARDSRQKALTGAVPIRKEKAEMEGLQATIEKMKVDHEAAAKKWKLAEARLYALIKDHTTHIESTEKQLLAVEQEKLLLLEFIGEQGLRLPKELRNSLQYRNSPDSSAKRGTAGSSVAQDVLRGKSPGANRNKHLRDQGYAEEVDVEFAESTTSTFHATPRGASGAAVRSATPTARSAPRLSSTHQPGEMNGRPSSALKSNLNATTRPGASAGTGSRVADMLGANASSSWARTSRSSAGSAGRYDSVDDEANSDLPFEGRADSEDVLLQTLGATAKNPVKAGTPRGQPDLPTGPATKSPVNSSTSMFKSNLSASATLSMGTVNLSAPAGASASGAGANGRAEEVLPDGKKLVKYKNGTQKEIDEAGNSLVRFLNGDTKSVNVVSGVVVYYYAQADTTHTTFKDGLEVYEFPNKQVEMHFPDGVKEIIFPDATRKIINPDGLQESHFTDGVILREHADGRREVLSGNKDT